MITGNPPPADLGALSGLLEKATPGPWAVGQSMAGPVWIAGRDDEGWPRIASIEITSREQIDAKLIVAAVNALPAIIAELTQARSDLAAKERRIEALETALRPFAQIVPSSFAAPDGSEAEEYCAILRGGYGNPPDFTGADLACARATLEDRG